MASGDSFDRGLGMFWKDLTPSEHLLQVYTDDESLFDVLEVYIGDGLRAGEGVILIATPQHQAALDDRLSASGIDLRALRARNKYVTADAEETLARMLINGRLDAARFQEIVLNALGSLSARRVRAFGEMVALLWGRGDQATALQLERLWHDVVRRLQFPLLCAYPRPPATPEAEEAMRPVCASHSKIVPGSWLPAGATS